MLGIGQAIQAYWKQIGVDSEIIYRDFAALRAKWAAHTLAGPAATMINQPVQLVWQPVAVKYFTCKGLLSSACALELDQLVTKWAAAPDEQTYVKDAEAVDRFTTDHAYSLQIVAAPSYFVGDDQIASDFTPGYDGQGINVRSLVASSRNWEAVTMRCGSP